MEKELKIKKGIKKISKQRLKVQKEGIELQFKKSKAEEIALKLQKERNKVEAKHANSIGMFGTATEPRKSLHSFLRNQNNFEVSAVSIIDEKAAILIRISTTVVTGLIVFHDYIDSNVVSGAMVSSVLIVGLLTSLILAIFAIKPLNRFAGETIKTKIDPTHNRLEHNAFFMWNSCDLQDYQYAMQKVVNSQDLQLGNQIRANFLLARNNSYKATMIKYAYNTFLTTFVLVGILFLLTKYQLIII